MPLVLKEISAGDGVVKRSMEEDVYAQIVKDLEEAAVDLPLKSEQAAGAIGRATKGAAHAFLAKAFVYQQKWNEAMVYSDSVIQSADYNLNDPYGNVWT